MSRRLEFVEDAARGLYSMTELCTRYAISRRVGYKWLARYFGTSERFWRNLQARHGLELQRDRLGPRLEAEVAVYQGSAA